MRTLIKTETFDTGLKCHCKDQGKILRELTTYQNGTGILGPNQGYQEFESEYYCEVCGTLFSGNIIPLRMKKEGLTLIKIDTEESKELTKESTPEKADESPDPISQKFFSKLMETPPKTIPACQMKKWLETK
jgi:hypothetical protein